MTQPRTPIAGQEILGSSPEIERVKQAVAQVARSRATVLLRGETGTGKELVARAIHEASGRTGPFVRVHCAALAEAQQEAEIFGHDSDPERRSESPLMRANGGTLLLDEVEMLSQAAQVRLLQVLEENELERAGSSEPERVDVRVIAATDKNLKELARQGKFRDDLLYRLTVFEIRLPPLRERRSDVPILARHFLEHYAKQNGKPVTEIGEQALALLDSYFWPGNVRELQNVIEHAVVLADGARIEPAHLPAEISSKSRLNDVPTVPGATIDELERYAILKTLEAVGGSTSKAAEKLGISVRKIQYKLQEYGSSGRGL